MTLLVGLLAVAVGVLTLIVFGLLRTHAEILRALDRLGVDLSDTELGPAAPAMASPAAPLHNGAAAAGTTSPVPADIVGKVPAGGPVKVSVADAAALTLLAFLSSGCRTCQGFWEAFADPALDLPGNGTRLVIVGQDPEHDSESALAALVPRGLRAVLSSAAWQDYDVPGSPYFVLVDGPARRIVGAGTAGSWQQIHGLLTQALGDEALTPRHPAQPGALATDSPSNREHRADKALAAAGIGRGHPSLYPDTQQPARSGRESGTHTEAPPARARAQGDAS